MVQKDQKLNKNKQPSGGKKVKKESKVDMITRLKKKLKRGGGNPVHAATNAYANKLQQRTEANVAAKAACEGNANLTLVNVNPQIMSKAKKSMGGRNQSKKR
eukprot:TRINITY_DN6153_c0_g4_i1.p1 TRINITY_DN6153_c0_g4~~TRINITY_DN6153_c0_g4_i1.p1  ORF type:complete len:102 (-),score=36.35 TRINITY_DN6153_c0_g4_i1:123-428(-)